jgi:hypothetical protein
MTRNNSLPQNKMHCSLKQQQHVSQWYATSISIWYLSDCIAECHWTGGKVRCQIGKALVREKLSKKVQFLQPNNDDMMKKVYAMARRYMNYDADDFSSIWTKFVLPTIKNEMNLLRTGYVGGIKNRIIRGKVICIVGCASACNSVP